MYPHPPMYGMVLRTYDMLLRTYDMLVFSSSNVSLSVAITLIEQGLGRNAIGVKRMLLKSKKSPP